MSESRTEEEWLAYTDHGGGGRPVLLIHGFGASRYTWRHVVAALSRERRLLSIDLKGFGSSPKPEDGRYSLYHQADLIHRFILRHRLEDVVLVGHSMGGGVALLVAMKLLQEQRTKLAALVLIDTIAYPQELPLFLSLLRTPLIGWLGVHLIPEEIQVRWLLDLAYHDRAKILDDQVAAYAAPLRRREAKNALLVTARQIIPFDLDRLVARYAGIDVPTLIVWGADDKIVPLAVGARLHNEIRASKFVVIDRSGHIPHEEMPEETISTLEAFLRRVS